MELNNKKKNRLYIVYEHYNFSQMTNFEIIKNLKYINLLEIRNYLKTNFFFLVPIYVYISFWIILHLNFKIINNVFKVILSSLIFSLIQLMIRA